MLDFDFAPGTTHVRHRKSHDNLKDKHLHDSLLDLEASIPSQVYEFALHVGWGDVPSPAQRCALANFLGEIAQDCSCTEIFPLELSLAIAACCEGYWLHAAPPSPKDYSIGLLSVALAAMKAHSALTFNAACAMNSFLTGDRASEPAMVFAKLLKFIADRTSTVRSMLAEDKTTATTAEVLHVLENEYNPPRNLGAYYFNKLGGAVRDVMEVKGLDAKKKATAFGYDEDPVDPCTKGAFSMTHESYCMFFFCVLHGHCWGESACTLSHR